MKQLNLAFKRTINWTKYQSKAIINKKETYLECAVDPSCWEVNRLFVLSFKNNDDRKVHTWHFLPKVEIKDDNVIINGRMDWPVKLFSLLSLFQKTL